MDGTSREAHINAAFVAVADTLTTEYDMVDLLHTLVESCASILHMDAGGLTLVDGSGRLQLMASTSETEAFVNVMRLNADAGPCSECLRTGIAVSVKDISEPAPWHAFQASAVDQGFRSTLATPLKLRGKVIGTMNLFGSRPDEVSARDAAVAQALADVATIGILQERVIREGHAVEDQLRHALESRIVIEQAKGVVANGLSLSMDDAFALLRKYARDHNLTLRSVSEHVSNREVSVDQFAALARS
ncbi:GAF domain-containing protein [Microbacterium endophyticum]|uniref:GAF domain-containing protein n=1 Tax=Microbacterium endophyticum TaxID=1526412 RepID=A0A7W4YMI9_9MICO|nr:GAF and ANTAR domain-containing protein [Microbacterium endophyticum]MBB2975172.1 GAF domain-containing protein [Microbacterium endophyticum]NIK37616.1 GAF domain-containing protein [Microbacterium endophyticum]